MKSRHPICLSSSSCITTNFVFSSLVIFLITATLSGSTDNQTDHLALLSFKSMITKDPYGVLSSWNSSFHFCDWSGVACGKRHKRVLSLQLTSQGLEGYLSPHLGNLSFLRELRLWNNSFQGTIPHEIGRLFRLRVLSLVQNKLDGVIPTNLSGCSNLEVLALGFNNLVGNIPKEVSSLSKLTFLTLHFNNLTGGIPPFLGNITSIESFSTTGNPLGGSIPDTLGHWKSLRSFYGGDCDLNGTIPPSIYNLSRLSNFSLSTNQLTGRLPPAIGTMLPHLFYLQLRNNRLTGHLPLSISNCSKLQILEMGDNNFTGRFRVNFSKLSDIYIISLGNNPFENREGDEIKFIDSLQNCSRLKRLDLRNSNFQGVLPTSIGNLSQQLELLVLQENQIQGSLPSSIGNLVSMATLSLAKNQFRGEIPSTIGMLQNLQFVTLLDNKFSGPIPDSMGNLSLLISLSLDTNKLEGHIPPSLGNCHNLIELYLDNNKLSGQIPKQLLQLSSLSIALNLSRNRVSGSLPKEVEDLKVLDYLDLSHNNISGSIPSSLGGCSSLSFLSLKGNLFQGIIPPSLSSLKGLRVLDLSQNNLSGNIPQFLEQFSLEFMNLSYNNFEGEVPTNGVFANASAFFVFGNSRLCGGMVELGLPKCKETEKHKNRFLVLLIVILIASVFLVVLCFVYAWPKKKSNHQRSHTWINEKALQISYGQLLKATDGFSEANLIGQGGFSSVYKGVLDHDDRFVAVKVLHLQNSGAHKSFIAECEAWQNIRHRNLLKIITSCSSVDFQGNDFKALVYEFMPNGSLHDWLHSSARTSTLTLLQRVKILVGVASALDYLHNHCLPTIIHCDLKPSNILLDDDMVAHIGDFGLARLLGTEANQDSLTRIKGTIGYAPPEYGLGSEMTSSGDVYSFGILLLEVMTRKKPTDDIFNEGFNLHKFASMALPDHVTDVIDGDAIATEINIVNAQKMEECLASIVMIGVTCSMDSPPQRMNMGNVVHGLHHILDVLQNI